MKKRLGVFSLGAKGRTAMLAVDQACASQGLPPRLLELVRLWCSLLNKCEFCITMHKQKALDAGVLAGLVSRLIAGETPSLGTGERAALKLATAMTMLQDDACLSEALAEVVRHFDQTHVITLCYVIAQINAWNRLAQIEAVRYESALGK